MEIPEISAMHMIKIKGLYKTYSSGTKAINGLHLSVKAGEILALLGPNGAGKSSTIRVLTTLSGFDEGNVEVAGFNVDTDANQVRQAIGYVAQQTGVDYFLSGRENLSLQGRLYRMTRNDIQQRIEELAGYFSLSDSLDEMVMNYSGGMRRKLDIAIALMHRPKLLFLDEPTLGLDISSRQALWKYIRQLNEDLGLTILLTTHYLEEADKLAHRVAIINQGAIKIIDTPQQLKRMIQGDVVSLEFPPGSSPDAALIDTIREQSNVSQLIHDRNVLHAYVTNGTEAIPGLLELARSHEPPVSNIRFAQPTLDDVFLKVTGGSMLAKEEEGEEKWWEKWAGKGGGKWAKKWQQAQENGDTEADADAPWNKWSKEEQQQWWSQQQGKKSEEKKPADKNWQQWQNKDDKDGQP